MGYRPAPIMIGYAAALHIVWSVCIWVNPASAMVTSVSAVVKLFDYPSNAAVLFIVATAISLGALWFKFRMRWLLLIPQQVVLLISAAGALSAMWVGHFSDGVARPSSFIVADQMYAVLTAIAYTVALILHARSEM